jgi:hypothetical protein
MIFNIDSWRKRTVTGFNIFELTLLKDQYSVVSGDIPKENLFKSGKIGVNTYRANAFVKGSFHITSKTLPDFSRVRGDGADESRVTVRESFSMRGLDDVNKFFCIHSIQKDKLYLSKNYPLSPGESFQIDCVDIEQNIFVIEGIVTVNDAKELPSFKHVRLTKGPSYSFVNNTDEDAFVVYMYEATKQEIIATLPNIPSENINDIEILRD